MTTEGSAPRPAPRPAGGALLRAGLLLAVVDGLFAVVLAEYFYDSKARRMFQGVASTLLGREAFDGGDGTAAIGVLMHFSVAFTWSAVFIFLVLRSGWIRRLLASPAGVIKVAAIYGPFIWLFMSCVVIPLLVQRPPNISPRWWIQLVGHIPFVGLPLVWASSRELRRQ